MKLDSDSREKLQGKIADSYRSSGLSYTNIGTLARVDVSQVSRICRGQFKTLSQNVMQICKVLGVEVDTFEIELPCKNVLPSVLEDGVLEVWDRTAADAERIVRFLHELAALRRTGQ